MAIDLWVDFEDQKPKRNGSYLVTKDYGNGRRRIDVAEWINDKWFYSHGELHNVIGWQSLPEPMEVNYDKEYNSKS